MSRPMRTFFVATGIAVSVSVLVLACGSDDDDSQFGPGGKNNGVPGGSGFVPDGSADGGDPYANDPFPPWCGPADAPQPALPTGSEQCPSDKNKPGCACPTLGEKAACWTGLRRHRGLGICKDGVTECVKLNENIQGWGPCEGEVLPVPGATDADQACSCFSHGEWKIDNLSPCFLEWCPAGAQIQDPDWPNEPKRKICDPAKVTARAGVSTYMGVGGVATCPTPSGPPQPLPSLDWSTDTLSVDCAGHFKLCYELKAGDHANPQPGDCSLGKVCTEADYNDKGAVQTFPPLGPWVTQDRACVEKWKSLGGYGEMTVLGKSVHCDEVDDGSGQPLMFNRVKYCPSKCQNPDNAALPECANCQQAGSGQF